LAGPCAHDWEESHKSVSGPSFGRWYRRS